MRIIGGRHRGRKLVTPAGLEVRPTSDRAREALFNILEHSGPGGDGRSPLIGARVFDGFAGSGALGLEALSRGAESAVFMDNAAAAIKAIHANVATLGEEARATIVTGDPGNPPGANQSCAILLLDPPYGSGLGAPALTALKQRGWIAPGAICSVEVAAKETFAAPAGFAVIDERRYGRAKIILLRAG
jgi:16S rRNA (guanine966-N2)-methyltransferase